MISPDYISALKDDVFRILYLAEQKDQNIRKYIETVVGRVDGFSEYVDSDTSKKKVCDVVVSLKHLAKTDTFTIDECRRIVLDSVNTFDRI